MLDIFDFIKKIFIAGIPSNFITKNSNHEKDYYHLREFNSQTKRTGV
jgi:hypothetical protein